MIAVILPLDGCYTVFEEERTRPQSVWYLLQPPVEIKLSKVDMFWGRNIDGEGAGGSREVCAGSDVRGSGRG